MPGFVATIGDAVPAVEAPRSVFAPTAEMPAALAPMPTLAPPRPAAAPRRLPWLPRRRRTHRRVMSRVILVGIAAAIALYAVGTGRNVVGNLRDGASVRTVPIEGGSLLRAAALEPALRGLPRGRVEALRVAADRIDARVVVDGHVRLVRVSARGWVTDVPAPEPPTGSTVRIDTRAPARLVRTAVRRSGRSPASVSHASLEGGRWQLVFVGGAQFSANTHGRDVRRG